MNDNEYVGQRFEDHVGVIYACTGYDAPADKYTMRVVAYSPRAFGGENRREIGTEVGVMARAIGVTFEPARARPNVNA